MCILVSTISNMLNIPSWNLPVLNVWLKTCWVYLHWAWKKTELKEIFRRAEINEVGYKKILNTLETQIARVKQEKRQQFAPEEYFIEPLYIRLINIVRKILFLPPKPADPEEVYLYYRTQYKLISKVIHELSALENSHLIEVFSDKHALKHMFSIYQELRARTE